MSEEKASPSPASNLSVLSPPMVAPIPQAKQKRRSLKFWDLKKFKHTKK